MTISNGDLIVNGIGIFTRPSTAVKNFATDSVEYAAFADDQVMIRIPIIDQVAIQACEAMNVYALFRSGSTTQNPLIDGSEYLEKVGEIKNGTIDNKTYHEYQQKLFTKDIDADYMIVLPNDSLPLEEVRNLRNKKKMEFESKMQSEAFKGMIKSSFRADLHYGSTIIDTKFKKLNRESKEIADKEEYSKYISSLDKITGSVIDERIDKVKIPVSLYTSKNADPEIADIINEKLGKSTIQTRDIWMDSWSKVMNFFSMVFPEDHKTECQKALDEVNSGLYGIELSGLSTSVLQKLRAA
ncbi:MAG: hypothetical protein V1678_04540 [Candidatus Aenigmatarchaeota archaeon]